MEGNVKKAPGCSRRQIGRMGIGCIIIGRSMRVVSIEHVFCFARKRCKGFTDANSFGFGPA